MIHPRDFATGWTGIGGSASITPRNVAAGRSDSPQPRGGRCAAQWFRHWGRSSGGALPGPPPEAEPLPGVHQVRIIADDEVPAENTSTPHFTSRLSELLDAGMRFGCIYADPPWQYDNAGSRAAAEDHYPTLSLPQICRLPIAKLAAAQSRLHLWTTNAFLFEAKQVMEAWGFEYKSCFVWVKPQLGMGNYWRLSHEFLLLGVRGNGRFDDRSQRSWVEIPRQRHSEKPDAIRSIAPCARGSNRAIRAATSSRAARWRSTGRRSG